MDGKGNQASRRFQILALLRPRPRTALSLSGDAREIRQKEKRTPHHVSNARVLLKCQDAAPCYRAAEPWHLRIHGRRRHGADHRRIVVRRIIIEASNDLLFLRQEAACHELACAIVRGRPGTPRPGAEGPVGLLPGSCLLRGLVREALEGGSSISRLRRCWMYLSLRNSVAIMIGTLLSLPGSTFRPCKSTLFSQSFSAK